jgi:GR25 family glycosyltransferase involved in LPS biosynthesis
MKQITLFLIIIAVIFVLYIYYCNNNYVLVDTNRIEYEQDLIQLVSKIDLYNKLYPRKTLISIPVYYINMDKSKERNEWMTQQLSKNVSRYYRVSGVNGYNIKNKDYDVIDGIEFYNDFKNMSLPEIGCTLSHLKAIRMAYTNGENMAIIMEDDVYIDMTNLLENSIEEIVENAPEEWEILQFVHLESNLNKSSKIFKQYTFHQHTRGKYESYTSSYLINRKGMENILKSLGNNPYYLGIKTSDYGVSDCIIYDNAKTFVIEPSILTPYNLKIGSTIHTDHTQIHLERSLNILKNYKKPVEVKGSTLKILNLIIYNENEDYERQMKEELETYLKQFENNVVFYFIAYRESQKDDITIEGNCIYIKGKDGFVPQVLDKTIIALQHCIKYLNIKFDFFVRSNISSIINFNLFPINELDIVNVYTGAHILKLEWLDPPYGINSENFHKLKGLKFASGTSIIMSKDVAEYLIKHQDKLDRTLIDDVSIGFLLSTQFKITELQKTNKFIVNEIDKDAFVTRNKSENRYDDISRMRKINIFNNTKNDLTQKNCLIISANFGNIDQQKYLIKDMVVYDDTNSVFPSKDLNPRLRAKYFRMCSHMLYPLVPFFIWVDSSIQLKDGIIDWMKNILGDYDAVFFKHSLRSSIVEENNYVNENMKTSYLNKRYSNYDLNAQVDSYLKDGFPDKDGLIETGLFLRKNTENVNKAFEHWFIEQVKWSIQDQLSLPYILWKHKINYKIITDYTVYEGPFHKYIGHK